MGTTTQAYITYCLEQNIFESFHFSKYESFLKTVKDSKEEPSGETAKQLEKMEKDLNNKEEEITMVISLYKEVSALKEQVKNLKQRSQSTLTAYPKSKTYSDPQAAVHLTKLLRQIQNYQSQCKTAVN